MRLLFGYIFLIALVELELSLAKQVSAPKLKQCCAGKRTKDSCEFLELSCPTGSAIYKPDVYPTSLSCKNGHSCYGVVISYTDLRTDILDCYWKSKCLIDISSIRRKAPHTSSGRESCPSSAWQNVMVKDWKCVEKAVISDICAGNKTHSIDIEQHHNKPSGVVRSHERFPWEYNKDIFYIKNNRYAPRCTVTFNGYLDSRKDFSRVAIYVASLDLSDDFNTAIIQDKALVEFETYVHNFTSGPVIITFGFNFTENTIKGGSGFVLYYKFLKVVENASSVNDLDIIETKQGTNATCIHNHQYFCPFQKMCVKKKMKLFVPSDNPENFCSYRSIKKPKKPKHCLKEEKHGACKVCKAAYRRRKWPMIINGTITEKYFTCKWMFKCKRNTTWNITLKSTNINRTFDSFTVKHFRCANSPMTSTTLERKKTYTMDEGDVITVEYSRRTDKELHSWIPPNTDIKMVFKQLRKRQP